MPQMVVRAGHQDGPDAIERAALEGRTERHAMHAAELVDVMDQEYGVVHDDSAQS
jgi:hypothetical protein